jgi:hypothetical protein
MLWTGLGLYVYLEYSHESRLDADLIPDFIIDFIQGLFIDFIIDLIQDLTIGFISDLTIDLVLD